MSAFEFFSRIGPWEMVALTITTGLIIYGLLSFIFSPITSRLDNIEKAIKDLRRERPHD